MSKKLAQILSVGERDTFVECERIIEKGQQTFVEVGQALGTIRERKLYRMQHATFEDYCQKRWGWSRMRSAQLIEAARVVESLPANVNNCLQNEGQVRAVAKVPEPKRVEVVESAKRNGNGKITAKGIEQAAAKVIEAETHDVQLDEIGREVPAEILSLWRDAAQEAANLLRLAREIKGAMKDGVDNRETNLIWIDCTNTDVSSIQQVINTVNLHVKPYAVCPTCHGLAARKSCKLCRKRGFVGRHLWNTVPEETKKIVSKGVK